jgi:ribosomal protein L7/L12
VLARAALLFDAPSLKLRDQKAELEIQVEYAKGSQKPANAEVNAAFRGVQFVELAEGLADAQRRGDPRASAEILQQLIRHAENEVETKAFYEDLLEELNERGKISQQRVNALVLGSTTMLRRKKKGPQLYEVVLMDAGESPIPFFRELRRLTGMNLRSIDDLVRTAPAKIKVLPFNDARALKKQLQATGARVEVRPRAD